MTAALLLEGATAGYGPRDVLHGVTLAVGAGEVVALCGPNGAGKTTLLRLASGALAPRRGRVEVLGRPADGWAPRDLARRVAFVPQRPSFPFPYHVEEYVALGRIPHLGLLGRPSSADLSAVEAALAACGLLALRAEPVTRISAGEAARAVLARAFAQGGDLLLLDEPTASLDPARQVDVMRLVRRRAVAGAAVLAAIHDLALAAQWSDRLIPMADGRIAADGAPADVLDAAAIERVFGLRAVVGRDAATGATYVVPALDGL